MIAKPFTYAALARKVRDVLDVGRTRRILLVERDPTVRLLITEVLSTMGYQPEEGANAAEALAKVRSAQGRYDLVLIDDDLEDWSGEQLLAELRALHVDLPTVLTSLSRAEVLRERFAKDGCTTVLAKPFSTATLARALEDLGVTCPRKAKAAD